MWSSSTQDDDGPIKARSKSCFSGCKQITMVKRLQMVIIFAVAASILLFQIHACVEKYVLMERGTTDSYQLVSNIPFPVMTICPTYPYKLDRLQFHGVPTKSDIQFNALWVSNDSSVSPQDFFHDVVYRVEEIVKSVRFDLIGSINGTNKLEVGPETRFCDQPMFTTRPYYYNGDCYSLDLPACITDKGILEIVFVFTMKTDIFIHHRGQFLSPNSRSRVDVDLGHFVKLAINHEVVQLLSEGRGSTCVNAEKQYDDCIYDSLENITTLELGCTVPWVPGSMAQTPTSKICTDSETSRTRAFQLYQQNRRNQKNICPNSCLFTNMYFGPPVTGMNNAEKSSQAQAVFYFRKDVKKTTEYFLYSTLSMLAEIGGYVGLLLGVSLFNVASINNVLIDCLYKPENQPPTAIPTPEKRNVLSGQFTRSGKISTIHT